MDILLTIVYFVGCVALGYSMGPSVSDRIIGVLGLILVLTGVTLL